ncbi:hypothetical protein B0H17DRAFT_305703 [Mycena rosella]|uniref:Uncharacterized protein n=1 Tax=Mycena rosella TaxID=1033263 RepID=A0AAD7DVG8_MYCRO|nr:hypothetical protein B0H17DRAFT_305703 [Mycena rosella]
MALCSIVGIIRRVVGCAHHGPASVPAKDAGPPHYAKFGRVPSQAAHRAAKFAIRRSTQAAGKFCSTMISFHLTTSGAAQELSHMAILPSYPCEETIQPGGRFADSALSFIALLKIGCMKAMRHFPPSESTRR